MATEEKAMKQSPTMNDGEWFTHKQIRAAWRKTEDLRASLKRLEQPELEEIICNAREELMKEWGIARCEGCGGCDPHILQWNPHATNDCNGEGWVKEEDE